MNSTAKFNNCSRCGRALESSPENGTTAGICSQCRLNNCTQDDEMTIAHSPSGSHEPAKTETLGQSFGEYTLLEEVARGGMGVVFKAKHRQLNRIVALKMILSGQLASELDVERFRQEAEAAANLDHPGIVPIYEIGEVAGQHFFTMKFVEGGTLADLFKAEQHDTRDKIDLLAQVAHAVHHAHQRGILHRDIKPANILVDEDGKPLVTDLGLAKDIKSESGLTQSGSMLGTPAYMPPEQATGEKDITTAADIYAIGAILYEALTGRPPYTGKSALDILQKVQTEEVVPPRQVDRKINRLLQHICMKCLQRAPNARYTSAGALADDLENWLAGRRINAKAISVTSIVGGAVRSSLQSAVGAASIGIIAGLLFSVASLSITLLEYGKGRKFDVHALYSSFSPELVPNLWFADWNSLYTAPALLAFPLVLFLTGLFVQILVRPKTGQQALAIGLVTGLMMTLSINSIGSFSSTSRVVNMSVSKDIDLLAQASVSAPDNRDQAAEKIYIRYPNLQEIEATERAALMKKKILTDAQLALPRGILNGLFTSLVIGLIPCVGCTIIAFRLYNRRPNVRQLMLPYLEVALCLNLLALNICIPGFLLIVPGDLSLHELTSGMKILCAAVPLLLAIPGFLLWPTSWRYAIYTVALGLLWCFGGMLA